MNEPTNSAPYDVEEHVEQLHGRIMVLECLVTKLITACRRIQMLPPADNAQLARLMRTIPKEDIDGHLAELLGD